jgi:hypothetical protein
VQFAPAPSELVQVVAEMTNWVLETEAEVIGRAALPALVSVAVIAAAVVLTTVDGNESVVVSAACGAVPVPERVAIWVAGVALSVTVTVPLRTTPEPGVKVTMMEQDPRAATEAPQLLVWVKPAPAATMLVMVSEAAPGFERVRVWVAALVPTGVGAKVRLEVRTACGVGAGVPVPVRATVWVPTESMTLRLADCAPVALGVKVMEYVQLVPAARELPQVLAEMANCVLEVVAEVMERAALPALERMTVWAAVVVPTVVEAKVRAGARAACGPVPVPASVAIWVPTLSTTEMLAVKEAAESGVNVTAMVQLAPAASVDGQVVVSEKSAVLAPVTLTAMPVRVAVPGLPTVST